MLSYSNKILNCFSSQPLVTQNVPLRYGLEPVQDPVALITTFLRNRLPFPHLSM